MNLDRLILEKQLPRRPFKTLEDQLREFHYMANQTIGRSPEIRDADLRARLIIEEAMETAVALLQNDGSGIEAGLRAYELAEDAIKGCLKKGDLSDVSDPADRLAKVIDGCADLIYVTVGTHVACGVTLDPFWNEVHRSNMMKAGAPIVDGKLMKPRGWKPPRIRELLDSLRPAMSDELSRWKTPDRR